MTDKKTKSSDQLSPLNQINKLEAVSYKYKTSEFPDKNFPEDLQHGFIAQEVERIVPLAVQTDESGMKYVNYSLLAPLLVEAVKELAAKVESQDQKIHELEKLIKKI